MTTRKFDAWRGDRSATCTPLVRTPDELSGTTPATDDENGESLSDAIRRFLADYVGDPGATGLVGSPMDRRSAAAREIRQ